MAANPIQVTPHVRVKLKERLVELGYGGRYDLMTAVEQGDFEELILIRRAIEAYVLAEEEARRSKGNMKNIFERLESKYKP